MEDYYYSALIRDNTLIKYIEYIFQTPRPF